MPNANPKPARWTAPVPQSPFAMMLDKLRELDVWTRVLLCAVTGLILWVVTAGWSPSFPYRARQAPRHNLHARAEFEYYDAVATDRARDESRRTAMVHYSNDPRALDDLQTALTDRLFVIKDNAYDEIDPELWEEFLGEKYAAAPVVAGSPVDQPDEDDQAVGEPAADSSQANDDPETVAQEQGEETQEPEPTEPSHIAYVRFAQAIQQDPSLESLKLAVENAFLSVVKNGLLENLEHEFGEGSTKEIMVRTADSDIQQVVPVSEVRIGEVSGELYARIRANLDNDDNIADPRFVADRIFDWLRPKLPTTLKLDEAATERSMRRAELNTKPKNKLYSRGSPLERRSMTVEDADVITAGRPLDDEDIQLLRVEHRAYVDSMSVHERVFYSLANWGMYVAVFSLLGGYLYYRDRTLIEDLRQFALLLGLFLITVVTMWVLAINVHWRAEIIPITMFAMTISVAYHRELALLLAALVALVFTAAHGYGVNEFVILTATSFVAALLCGRIRSRTRLVYIGLIGAAVAFPTTLGIGTMTGQPLGSGLILDGLWFAGGALLAGLFMTALLPFLEQWFGIGTDISLLELSDANHPLLKQLVQRAPGTYNHSINVASISEAAAEAIGANGLLCRVGAYFHDIGKMRKPEYFVENQGSDGNKHDDLVPTMSTLVIIAHVKDGAEMARKHHLPQRIIDMIEQHHGTTLVEYFYRQQTQKKEGAGEPTDVEEADFRYPGPKPQTREAAVMMLSDSVESASRTLREPTPARLENLVKSISKKKLDDGQFDQCALTLQELRIIENSLIKSLNAMYHARVKYPDQQQPA